MDAVRCGGVQLVGAVGADSGCGADVLDGRQQQAATDCASSRDGGAARAAHRHVRHRAHGLQHAHVVDAAWRLPGAARDQQQDRRRGRWAAAQHAAARRVPRLQVRQYDELDGRASPHSGRLQRPGRERRRGCGLLWRFGDGGAGRGGIGRADRVAILDEPFFERRQEVSVLPSDGPVRCVRRRRDGRPSADAVELLERRARALHGCVWRRRRRRVRRECRQRWAGHPDETAVCQGRHRLLSAPARAAAVAVARDRALLPGERRQPLPPDRD
mmetsp:Transcript_9609/g.24646  ORF Transcript_9609/g.24646 Transcript_9609/m.24646 type:complete len:272 (+) Transcript_9609:1835-2650(+)